MSPTAWEGNAALPVVESASRWWQGFHFNAADLAMLELVAQANSGPLTDIARSLDELGQGTPAYTSAVREWINVLDSTGLWALGKPREFGGCGFNLTTACIALEELATVFPAAARSLASNICASGVLSGCAQEPSSRELLQLMGANAAKVALVLPDMEPGSDIPMVPLTATWQDGSLRIFGEQPLVMGVGLWDFVCISVRVTEPSDTLVIVASSKLEGLKVVQHVPREGLKGLPIGALKFDGVTVPKGDVLIEGDGLAAVLEAATWDRVVVGAIAAGIARGCFDRAVQYAQQGDESGKQLIQQVAVRHQLAEAWSKIEAVRSLMFRAAACCDAGESIRRLGAAVKVMAFKIALEVASLAKSVTKLHGMTSDHLVERLLRDIETLQSLEEFDDVLLARTIPASLFGL